MTIYLWYFGMPFQHLCRLYLNSWMWLYCHDQEVRIFLFFNSLHNWCLFLVWLSSKLCVLCRNRPLKRKTRKATGCRSMTVSLENNISCWLFVLTQIFLNLCFGFDTVKWVLLLDSDQNRPIRACQMQCTLTLTFGSISCLMQCHETFCLRRWFLAKNFPKFSI